MRPGEEWGRPATDADRDRAVAATGGDAGLAAAATAEPDGLWRPDPAGDLARALGLRAAGPGTRVVPCDVVLDPGGPPAVNAVVLGTAPDRLRRTTRRRPVEVHVDDRPLTGPGGAALHATTVVVASGQYLRGLDLVPRGHPGDGRLEILVFGLTPGERSPMRRRLPAGQHLPHPRIVTATGRRVRVRWTRPHPVEVDGRPGMPRTAVDLTVAPGALDVLV